MSTASTNYARDLSQALSSNKHLLRWVEKMAELTKPDSIHWVTGSEEENEAPGESLRMFSWLLFQTPGAPVLFVL